MFKRFEDAEQFIEGVIQETRRGEIRWEHNGSDGFVQMRSSHLPAFHLFAEQPRQLILRGLGEAYDLVVSAARIPNHDPSLRILEQSIIKQLGLLF